jgi:hypothetical protein
MIFFRPTGHCFSRTRGLLTDVVPCCHWHLQCLRKPLICPRCRLAQGEYLASRLEAEVVALNSYHSCCLADAMPIRPYSYFDGERPWCQDGV